MKKIQQNVLAQNSNNDIAYLCGKCGKEIEKEALECIFCGAKLGNIRCPFCNFVGSVNDFKADTCPRCGRKSHSDSGRSRHVNNTKSKKSVVSRFFWLFLLILIGIIITLSILFIHNFDLF